MNVPPFREPPRVLVLLAARNGASWIGEQIQSILQQRDVAVNLLISDDASRDDTLQVIKTQFACDRRVVIHGRTTASGSAAANFRHLIATAAANDHDYVAFADQDDVWFEDKLVRACRALSASSRAGYSAAVSSGIDLAASRRVHTQCAVPTSADFLFEGAGQGCTFVMKTTFFLRVQTFVNAHPTELTGFHFHDWMVYVLCRAWDETWYFDTRPSMWYRQHASNDIGARGSWHAIGRRLSLIRSGWYGEQVKRAATLYEMAGGRDKTPIRLTVLLRAERSGPRQLALAWKTLFESRRRLLDRLIVSAAALGGFL